MSWNIASRPLRLLLVLCFIPSAPAISIVDTALDSQIAGLNVSDHVQVEQLISLWGGNAGLTGFEPQLHLHGRSPHPRALGELHELFSRQVKCGGGSCPTGACCTRSKEGKDICCGGRCCTGWCCGNDDRCSDSGGCIWPTKWETRTTTVTSTSTVTQTSSVSGTTTSWVTSKITSTSVTTISNIATATQIETKVVTITDAAAATQTKGASKRAVYVEQPRAAGFRPVQDRDANSEPASKHIYYLRRSPQLDILANALSNRGLSILRRDWVTSTRVDTATQQTTSTVVNTFTNWRVLTSTSMLTDTVTSTSYLGAATTVTSTTTSTTRVPPGFTPSISTASDTSSPTTAANTSGNSQSDGKPVAAIVGGVVGGVAGLALIGAIIFAIKRRRHWAEQDAENDRKIRASTLGMPEGKPDYGPSGDPWRGAVPGWGESNTAGTTSGSAPSWTSDPASRTGSGMAMSGQWHAPPVPAPMPLDQGMYAHEQRSLSGQWYPQQQPQQLDSGEVMEMPGHGEGQLSLGQQGGYGGQRY